MTAMFEIALAREANQSFTTVLDGARFDLTFRDIGGDLMAVTIIRDGVTLVEGQRLVAGTPLLPYKYQETGNFMLLTQGGAYPYWPEFGVTQTLLYLTAAEVAANG